MNELTRRVDSGILHVTIDRPDRRNALNRVVLAGIREALDEAAANRGIRVFTITGAGEQVFCAGADLKAATPRTSADDAFGSADYRDLLVRLLSCPKPTVALARGHVMAGGLGLYLSCDLALACDDVYFSTPEIHVGMFPMMVLALLYRHVGRKRATEMLFLGERIAAPAAMEYGLVNHVFPREQFDGEAAEYLEKLTSKSAEILRRGKEAIRAVEDADLPESLQELESALAGVMASSDSREGIRAFIEKRKPEWRDE
jgi:enoyl-CoA hydratase